jgi:hypothetical protein
MNLFLSIIRLPDHTLHITGHISGTPNLCCPVGKRGESSTSERCSENEMRAKFKHSSAKCIVSAGV